MFSRLLMAIVVLAALVFGAVYLLSDRGDVHRDNAEDLPETIRVPGGLLEVITLARTENFVLPRPTKIFIWKTDVCSEKAEVRVRAYPTYRIRLAPEWEGQVKNGTLHLRTPPLEPSLPVAFDTATFRKEVDKCWFVPNRDTMIDLEKDISRRLKKKAQSAAYKKYAKDNGAADTVEEFVRKWLISQTQYATLPEDIPVQVSISD